MQRVGISFGSLEKAKQALQDAIDNLDQVGTGTIEVLDESSVDGSPIRIEFTNEDNDEFDMPVGVIEERDY